MKYYASILVTIILFSTIEVVSKILAGSVDTIFLSFLRFFFSGLIITLISFKDIRKIEKKDLPMMCWLGFAGVTLALGAFHISLNYIEASKAAVIFSINPVFTALFAGIIFGEKLNTQKITGIILGFAGVWILNFGFSTVKFNDLKGPGLMLFAAVFFAYYIVASKKYVAKYGAFATTGILFITGSLFYLPFIDSFRINNFQTNWLYIAYLSLLATGVAYLCYFYGLRHVSTATGASLFYLKPIIASFLSVLILKEQLSYNFYIGLLIIITALTVTLMKPIKNLKEAEV